jgi:hypothetical protein
VRGCEGEVLPLAVEGGRLGLVLLLLLLLWLLCRWGRGGTRLRGGDVREEAEGEAVEPG